MTSISLSRRDINVLDKIKDPESNPLANLVLEPSLPRDPHITDTAVYERVIQKERDIVLSMQQLELQLAGLKPKTISEPIKEYKQLLARLDELISEHPKYASARNNRVQALRRLYGDTMLLGETPNTSQRLIQNPDPSEKRQLATSALGDLETSIALLTPRALFAAISPQAAKTLALAYTQRAAIYHMTAKHVDGSGVAVNETRREATWAKIDFEEAASQDFAMGGRYGNAIAKGLAVSTNPTAKLCGQMVREAMKKEYGPEFSA